MCGLARLLDRATDCPRRLGKSNAERVPSRTAAAAQYAAFLRRIEVCEASRRLGAACIDSDKQLDVRRLRRGFDQGNLTRHGASMRRGVVMIQTALEGCLQMPMRSREQLPRFGRRIAGVVTN